MKRHKHRTAVQPQPHETPYYTPGKTKVKKRRIILLILAISCILGGLYLGYLSLSPKIATLVPIKTKIDLNTTDDSNDHRNRIQIQKINLEVPFYEGDAGSLDRGAWHRFPDRGNPVDGGNFILSAHRFNIGTTPVETKERSPFYNIDKLKVGDSLRVFYNDHWYDYIITKTYNVKPNAIEIEAPSEDAHLTLYSCSLGGSADGRSVIEAKIK